MVGVGAFWSMGRDRNATSNTSVRVMEEVATEAGDMDMACKGSFLWKLDLNLTFIRTYLQDKSLWRL